jgi:endonuclease III
MVAHGRAICTDRNPKNNQCVIRRHCKFVLDAFRSQYRK